jgi:hypothetical protein
MNRVPDVSHMPSLAHVRRNDDESFEIYSLRPFARGGLAMGDCKTRSRNDPTRPSNDPTKCGLVRDFNLFDLSHRQPR